MNKNIIRFIEKQTCASICCADNEGHLYCFSCYYSFNIDDGLLYFKSSADAHHSALLKKNPIVAGTILPDTLSKLTIRGLQFQGELLEHYHPLSKNAFKNYHIRHPLAIGFKGDVFVILINQIKMTDSSFGFGKKIYWSRKELIPH